MEVSRLSTSDWLGQFDAVTINSTATEMTDPEVGSSVIQEGIGDGLGVVGVETLLGNGVGMDVAGKYTAVGDAYGGSCVGVGKGSREGAGRGHIAGIDGADPSLRLANLMTLSHNTSVDLYVDTVIRHAKLVVVRCLGGIEAEPLKPWGWALES